MKEGVMGVCAAVYNESHGYRTYVHVTSVYFIQQV